MAAAHFPHGSRSKKPTESRGPRQPSRYMDQEASSPEFDHVSDHFFRQPSLAPVEIEAHDQDWDHPAPAMSPGARRAMHATLAMLGVSLAAVGGFLFYSNVWMPAPVELGAQGVSAPQPLSHGLVDSHVAVAQAMEQPAAQPTAAPATPVAAELAAAPVPEQEAGAMATNLPTSLTTSLTTDKRVASAAPTTHASSNAPNAGDLLLKQAYRSLNHGNPHDALARARRVLNDAPTRADAWLVVASAYDAMQDRQSAHQAFRNCAARARGPYVAECRKLARE